MSFAIASILVGAKPKVASICSEERWFDDTGTGIDAPAERSWPRRERIIGLANPRLRVRQGPELTWECAATV